MKLPVRLLFVLLYLCVLAVLVSLGSWQVARGFEKADVKEKLEMSENSVTRLTSEPQDWEKLSYQMVELSGEWDHTHSFLLDNRISGGVSGVEVLTPFTLEKDEATLLVNRGWVARQEVDKVMSRYSGLKKDVIAGQIYKPSRGFTLGPAYTDASRWPVLIQYIDNQSISELINRAIVDHVLVMNSANGDFRRIWKPYIISAERHYGYAMQWWGLAIVFIVFGLIWKRGPGKARSDKPGNTES